MVDKNKIILMTKLAIYDKKYGVNDKKILQYYKLDYIYVNNVLNRVYALLGSGILLFFYLVKKILINDINLLTLNYNNILLGSCIFIIIIMCVYTAVGTVRSACYYNKADRRAAKYISGLKLLLTYDDCSSSQGEYLKEESANGSVTAFTAKKY